MRDSLFLAWQYLRHNRSTTAVLVASLTLILYLPVALQVIVTNAEKHFRSRAHSTPLLIGPRGSALELVLASVYFDKPYEEVMRLEQLRRVEKQQLGAAIPLHTRFTARDCQIVGTTKNYLGARQLHVAKGRGWRILGECVVGASVADRLRLQVGDKIPVLSSPAFVLDSPPLRLSVSGVLDATETPDDEAVFVDVETTWILEGLGHGHAASAQHGSPEAQLFTDITKDTTSSFHFHGDRDKFPITAVMVIPASDKAETILLGQYFSPDESAQILRPDEVMESLMKQILMVRSYIVAAIALVSLVTLLTMSLVFILSIRLRRSELVSMFKMGCSRYTVACILGMQVAILLAASLGTVCMLTVVTNLYGPELVRFLIL